MQSAIEKMLYETAATAYGTFPEALKKLVVLVIPDTDKPLFAAPDVAAQLTQDTSAMREAIKTIAQGINPAFTGGAMRNYELAGTSIDMIVLVDSGNNASSRQNEMAAVYPLDHEIGHHILRNGYPDLFNNVSPHLAESAADAFAMLRHMQRFGKDTDWSWDLGDKTVLSIVLLSDAKHYTADAIRMAREMAAALGDDFFTLPLERTAELAAQAAEQAALDSAQLKRIEDAFQPVRDVALHVANSNLTPAQRATALSRETRAVMRRHQDDVAIVTAGKRFLSAPELKALLPKPRNPQFKFS